MLSYYFPHLENRRALMHMDFKINKAQGQDECGDMLVVLLLLP